MDLRHVVMELVPAAASTCETWSSSWMQRKLGRSSTVHRGLALPPPFTGEHFVLHDAADSVTVKSSARDSHSH
ncbi:hypothetical protein INR49_007200 [Caranx melampygus]|nr:hypothetical protein INR49_007200 [Caranx melampygus]